MSGVVSEKRGEKRIKGVNARRREKNENDRRTDQKGKKWHFKSKRLLLCPAFLLWMSSGKKWLVDLFVCQ